MEASGFRQIRRHSAKLRAQQNVYSNAQKTMIGTALNALQDQKRQTAKGFRQTHSGIQQQKSHKIGMETNGFLRISVLTTLRQAILNVISNAGSTTLGTEASALQTLRQLRAQDFRLMQSGTAFRI